MLNKPIWNPIATATAEMYSGMALLTIDATDVDVVAKSHIDVNAVIGLRPTTSRAIEAMARANRMADTGASNERRIFFTFTMPPPLRRRSCRTPTPQV